MLVLAPNNAKTRVEAQSIEAGAPWAVIKDPMFKMLDELRKRNIFVACSEDTDTCEALHNTVVTQNKCVSLGLVTVLTRDEAKKILEESGKELMGVMWSLAKTQVFRYLDYLYVHSTWLCLAGSETDGELIRAKSQEKNLGFRFKTGA